LNTEVAAVDKFSSLENKVAFITGGARGIGEALAWGLVADGAKVVLADLDLATAKKTAAKIGGNAHAVQCDVTDRASIAAALQDTVEHFGGLDILINNAGRHHLDVNLPCTQLSPEKWRTILDINIIGVVNCSTAAVPFMRLRNGGVILNLASYSGYVVNTAYGVTKLAVRGLTVALAQELSVDNIRVNAIAPGLIASKTIISNIPQEITENQVNNVQYIKRLGTPSDLVGISKLLCSDSGNFITGETIMVSGGAGMQV
jgi:3-oxoacyl-[acyl-carrier protein] reductase